MLQSHKNPKLLIEYNYTNCVEEVLFPSGKDW